MNAILMLRQWRAYLARIVAPLSDEQMHAVPPGFNNNIFWNLGHSVVTQQLLHYGRSDLPLRVSDAWVALFGKGTSPADWDASLPHRADLLEALARMPEHLEADYEAGRFTAFRPYETSTGIRLGSLEDALEFNNIHEGMHTGSILALRRQVV